MHKSIPKQNHMQFNQKIVNVFFCLTKKRENREKKNNVNAKKESQRCSCLNVCFW